MRSLIAIITILLWDTWLAAAVQLADLLAFTSYSTAALTETPGLSYYSRTMATTETPTGMTMHNLDLRDAPPANPPAVDNTNNAAPNPVAGALNPNPVAPNANPAAPNANPVAHPNAIPNPAAPNANPAAPAAPGNPALNPAGGPVAPVAAPPAVPPIKPTTTGASITVQWVETWIGGTSQTWVPQTVTFNMQAFVTEAPKPGRGEIGMGTIEGEIGVTRTVFMGGAPNTNWARMGGVVGIGMGAVGLL